MSSYDCVNKNDKNAQIQICLYVNIDIYVNTHVRTEINMCINTHVKCSYIYI
jgi:hypothetical protein